MQFMRCLWSFRHITEIINCIFFLLLHRRDFECLSLNWEQKLIKCSGIKQINHLVSQRVFVDRQHMSSFIFSQFTWWINSLAACLAPILHLHKSNSRWTHQTSPLAQHSPESCVWLRHPSPWCPWQRGLAALFDLIHIQSGKDLEIFTKMRWWNVVVFMAMVCACSSSSSTMSYENLLMPLVLSLILFLWLKNS